MDKVCGTCKWHKFEKIGPLKGYVCDNVGSDYCASWTQYDEGCDQWDGETP